MFLFCCQDSYYEFFSAMNMTHVKELILKGEFKEGAAHLGPRLFGGLSNVEGKNYIYYYVLLNCKVPEV